MEVTSIGYQGNGEVLYDSTHGGNTPVVVTNNADGAAFCFDPVYPSDPITVSPINVVTFTNARTDGTVLRRDSHWQHPLKRLAA